VSRKSAAVKKSPKERRDERVEKIAGKLTVNDLLALYLAADVEARNRLHRKILKDRREHKSDYERAKEAKRAKRAAARAADPEKLESAMKVHGLVNGLGVKENAAAWKALSKAAKQEYKDGNKSMTVAEYDAAKSGGAVKKGSRGKGKAPAKGRARK
jgi:hypothetical protein